MTIGFSAAEVTTDHWPGELYWSDWGESLLGVGSPVNGRIGQHELQAILVGNFVVNRSRQMGVTARV